MASRSNILWCGKGPNVSLDVALKERGLSLSLIDNSAIDSLAPQARGVVFSVTDPKCDVLKQGLDGQFAIALSHGLQVVVLCPLEHATAVRSTITQLPFGGRVPLWETSSQTSSLPELFARLHLAAPLSRTVRLEGCEGCSSEDIMLLRRAFEDSAEVYLTPLPGGRSARVFQVFAKIANSRVGPHPLPFFVKLDRYPKIARELRHYRDATALFVPFYARPNIDERRCVLGATRGVIVGNFVEHSESLTEAVKHGTSQPAINSLFDDALRGWRLQAYGASVASAHGPLAEAFGGAIPKTFPPAKIERANAYASEAKAFGATASAEELAALIDGLPPQDYRTALAHGDLHGRNVRVRHGQAILIDFAAVRPLPLCADPAALETALCLDMTASNNEWLAFMDRLYEFDHLHRLPPPAEPGSQLANYWNSIRQIRKFGLAEQQASHEYAVAVAISMLRHSLRNRDEKRGEAKCRRPKMLAIAERIARSIGQAV